MSDMRRTLVQLRLGSRYLKTQYEKFTKLWKIRTINHRTKAQCNEEIIEHGRTLRHTCEPRVWIEDVAANTFKLMGHFRW